MGGFDILFDMLVVEKPWVSAVHIQGLWEWKLPLIHITEEVRYVLKGYNKLEEIIQSLYCCNFSGQGPSF